MKSILTRFITIILLSIAPTNFSASLTVYPLQLNLTTEEPITTLFVTNAKDTPVTMQASVFEWTQQQNNHITIPTKALVISPLMFELAAHETQLVRVAWLTKKKLSTQGTYRVLLREIVPQYSQATSTPQKNMNIALAFSIPLFIQPINSNSVYEWHYQQQNNSPTLTLVNKGNVTLFINEFNVLTQKKIFRTQKTFVYVLPKHTYTWHMQVSKKPIDGIHARINGEWATDSVQRKM